MVPLVVPWWDVAHVAAPPIPTTTWTLPFGHPYKSLSSICQSHWTKAPNTNLGKDWFPKWRPLFGPQMTSEVRSDLIQSPFFVVPLRKIFIQGLLLPQMAVCPSIPDRQIHTHTIFYFFMCLRSDMETQLSPMAPHRASAGVS